MSTLSLEALRSIYDGLKGPTGSKKARLYETCLKMVEQGFWHPGDRLPTDLALTEHLPVSLGTVQAVFRRLKAEKLITRNKRQGSFLAEAERINRDYRFFAFLGEEDDTFVRVTVEDFTIDLTSDSGPWSSFLGNPGPCIRITRTTNVGGEFRLHSDMYLSAARFQSMRDIPEEELTRSGIIYVLQVHFGTPLLKSHWSMRFCSESNKHAEKLKNNPDDPVIMFDIRGHTLRNEPLLFHRILVPRNDHIMSIAQ